MPINWGVIGAGGIADRRTIPEGIIPGENSSLVAVMDITPSLAEAIGEKYDVKYYDNQDDLLNDSDVQAVYIATPVYAHAEQTIAAAQAGKHVFCEKPMALTIEECEQMIEACRANNVKLGLGFMMRFHAYHQKMRQMIADGKLGRVAFCRAQLSCWYPPIEGAWRQDPERGGGGSLVDMGNHCIDVLETILDSKVREVVCFADTLVHGYSVEDTASVLLRFRSNAQGVVDNSFSVPDASLKNRLEIYGSKGSILAEGTIGQGKGGDVHAYFEEDEKGYEAQQNRDEQGFQKIIAEEVNTYRAEIEAFGRAVESDQDPPVSGEDGLWSQKVMLACYESARTRKVVKLE